MSELVMIEPEEKKPRFEEPLISFIVPAYQIATLTLRQCLDSLLDQDYPNVEIIVVLDGRATELAKVVSQYKGVKLIEIEHAGACAARNAGFQASSGEIVSFFNSDYKAKPGMVRRWIDSLLEHPECGFAYGGYEYATARAMSYPSKPFDEFLLSVANYIDCGFPLWRKYVVEWDTNCKSLQDWDFWLRVVRSHHVKGYYLGGESSFLAEPSGQPGGLSEDSARNWIDRVHYIKAKNGISEPELCVTSLGAANHGVEIAKILGSDFRDDTLFKPDQYKALYMIGFYNRGEDLKAHANIIANYKARKNFKVIVHFVGADIYWLRHRSYSDLKYLSGALNLQCSAILCENEQAQKELQDMGIRAQIVPIPPSNDYDLAPLPEQFRIATFLTNRSDFDKYCMEETLSIIRATPDVEWSAYGDAADASIQYANLKCVGNLSKAAWKEFVYAHSALFRLVRHDTFPLASAEFLLAGRGVISNVPAQFITVIDTKGTFELNAWDIFQEGLNSYNWPKTKKQIVRDIRDLAKYGPVILKESQHAYYADLLDKKKYIAKIAELTGISKEES